MNLLDEMIDETDDQLFLLWAREMFEGVRLHHEPGDDRWDILLGETIVEVLDLDVFYRAHDTLGINFTGEFFQYGIHYTIISHNNIMNTNEIISSIAFGIGFIQMYNQVETSDALGKEAKHMLMLSTFTSSLWLVYQYRKFGLNISTVYTSAGLIVQLYVLRKLLLRETDVKEV